MTSFSSAAGPQDGWRSNGSQSNGSHRCGFRMGWKPIEIAAVVLGFAIWWPLGLGMIALKLAQRRGYDWHDMADKLREKFADFSAQPKTAQWRPFSASSGNAAFDEWRAAEMTRLEEERRKLEAAQREFADYMDKLRRARDREEFDRFMNARSGNRSEPDA